MFVIFLCSDWFLIAHQIGTATIFSSDGPNYYKHYIEFSEEYSGQNFYAVDRFYLFVFNKSPTALLILFGGDVAFVIFISGLVGLFSVYILLDNISFLSVRRKLFCFLFFVPFFSFSFFSLNKEIYIGSATLIFLTYVLNRKFIYFMIAVVIAGFGRPLFILILMTAFLYVNNFKRRHIILFGIFSFFSILPFVNISIPGAPDFRVHDDAGRLTKVTHDFISNGLYFLIYPVKYIGNILLKLRTVFTDDAFERLTMYLDLLTSLTFIIQLVVVFFNRKLLGRFAAGRIILFLIVFLPIPLLYFNFSQVRYIYFIQFLCVFLIANISVYKGILRDV